MCLSLHIQTNLESGMSKIGYIFSHPSLASMQWVDDYGLDKFFADKSSHEQTRPKLKEAMASLQPGDEFIIVKLSNAARSLSEAMLLIDLCRMRGVRLISIEDRVDTHDLLFERVGTEDLLVVFSTMTQEIIAMRQSLGEERLQRVSGVASTRKAARIKRDHKVISLYLAGHSLDLITRHTGAKRSNIYNILKRNGIGRDRVVRKSNAV